MDWMNQVHKKITENLDSYERSKFTLDDDDINAIMPKVVEFYNNHPKDQDVYRDENGVILLIQTPKAIKGKDGKLVNAPEGYDSKWNEGTKQYLIRNCKFRIYGETKPISIFASDEEWKKMGTIYDKKAFIKASSLQQRYKKIGSDEKAMSLSLFLKKYELEDIEEIDESEYIVYYTVNISQVIE